MNLKLDDVKEEDRMVMSPCGIICLGCDLHKNEGLEAAKTVVKIWKGFNFPDLAGAFGFKTEEVVNTIETLKKYIDGREGAGECPGCFEGGWPSEICSVSKCVRSKGYWTCAECEDFDPGANNPCPNSDSDPGPMGSRKETLARICIRYASNNVENLKRCCEIGYPAFIAETREKVGKGWRTWQVISKENVFTPSENSG